MSYLSLCILAFALSVDAFVVSFSYGLKYKEQNFGTASSLGLFTGCFQAMMPILGYYLTELVKAGINQYAELIACAIFCFLGIKFILESFRKEDIHPKEISIKTLILIGIATSIDAFSAGITLSLFGNNILKSALLIGIVTYINSIIGFWLGEHLKNKNPQILEIFAGILLIGLGIKSLL